MRTIIPQEIARFVPPTNLGGEYKIKRTYFDNSPVRIHILQDGRVVVHKVSTGCVALAENYQQAVGIRLAAMQRYVAVERLLA